MKYLLSIPLFLFSLFAPLPVYAQNAAPITPTLFFCVGNNPQPPCATIPPSQSIINNSPAPSNNPITSLSPGTSTNPQPSGTNSSPSSNPSPSTNPCTIQQNSVQSQSTGDVQALHHDKEHHSGKQGLLQQFFQLLLQLLQLLFQQLGIKFPIPGANPCPPTPSPSPSTGTLPSSGAQPATGTSPATSTAPSSAAQPPTGGATPGSGSAALEPSGQAIPTNNVSGWKLVFSDDFPGTVPLGAFSNCSSTQTPTAARCAGLKPYGAYYNNWWAYPSGWPDTAKSGADGNTGAPFGGTYQPEKAVSVSNGAMHIHMYRPTTGGDNVVATVVPIPCMNQKYGRYTERFKVVHEEAGFKSAHLFYNGGFEIDYPENDYGTTISAYTHPGGANFNSGVKWTDWHTTVIEWTAGSVKFYMDGKLIGTTTAQVPNIAMDWILQNESSIIGPYAANGASSQLDIDWVACYSQG